MSAEQEKALLDSQDIICDIGTAIEEWDGEKLARLHREVVPDSNVVYIGSSLFAKDQGTLERARELGKEIDEDA
jgi:hypothetical protein